MTILSNFASAAQSVSALSSTARQVMSNPQAALSSAASAIGQKAISTVASAIDPMAARLGISGLASKLTGKQPPKIGFGVGPAGNAAGLTSAGSTGRQSDKDWRVRIYLADSADAPKLFYQSAYTGEGNVLYPLKATNGVIFPYTPTITFAYQANYERLEPTHSNYPYYFYRNSEVRPIEVTGDFSVQNVEEAKYLLAAMHFFRTLTKMFYANGRYAGNPPPLVYLDGYGEHLIQKVPCAVTTFMHTMPENVDYMPIGSQEVYTDYDGAVSIVGDITNTTWVPMHSSLQVTLLPMMSREEVGRFNLEDYAKGNMLKTSIGGKFL